MANRVLLVGLSLSVAGGVALASWTRRGSGPPPPPPPRPVAATPSVVPVAAWVDLGDDPTPADDDLPTEETRSSAASSERVDPSLDDDLRLIVERMNWCGTGDVGRVGGDASLPEPVDDDSLRVRIVNDVAWNSLVAELRKTARAVDRLALVRTFLADRARSTSREDVAALARDLASIEPHRRLARRLDLAADALVSSADDAWLAYLEPPPPPPPPSTARPPGR